MLRKCPLALTSRRRIFPLVLAILHTYSFQTNISLQSLSSNPYSILLEPNSFARALTSFQKIKTVLSTVMNLFISFLLDSIKNHTNVIGFFLWNQQFRTSYKLQVALLALQCIKKIWGGGEGEGERGEEGSSKHVNSLQNMTSPYKTHILYSFKIINFLISKYILHATSCLFDISKSHLNGG